MNFEIFILLGDHTSPNVPNNPCFQNQSTLQNTHLGSRVWQGECGEFLQVRKTSVCLCHRRIWQDQQVQRQPVFFLWASLQFLSTKTPAKFEWSHPCSDLHKLTLWETAHSANILTHTKPTDKVRETVAWPLADESSFPQVLFTHKATGQSLISFELHVFTSYP